MRIYYQTYINISPIVEWSHSVKLASVLYNLGFQFLHPRNLTNIYPNTSWWLNQPHLNNMRKSREYSPKMMGFGSFRKPTIQLQMFSKFQGDIVQLMVFLPGGLGWKIGGYPIPLQGWPLAVSNEVTTPKKTYFFSPKSPSFFRSFLGVRVKNLQLVGTHLVRIPIPFLFRNPYRPQTNKPNHWLTFEDWKQNT